MPLQPLIQAARVHRISTALAAPSRTLIALHLLVADRAVFVLELAALNLGFLHLLAFGLGLLCTLQPQLLSDLGLLEDIGQGKLVGLGRVKTKNSKQNEQEVLAGLFAVLIVRAGAGEDAAYQGHTHNIKQIGFGVTDHPERHR